MSNVLAAKKSITQITSYEVSSYLPRIQNVEFSSLILISSHIISFEDRRNCLSDDKTLAQGGKRTVYVFSILGSCLMVSNVRHPGVSPSIIVLLSWWENVRPLFTIASS